MPSDTASAPDGAFPAGRDYGATLWAPDAATIERARITHYARWLAAERNVLTEGYEQLWRWSVVDMGLLRGPRRAGGRALAQRRAHAGRHLVPGELCELRT